jgi:hypothetical protein
MEIFRRNRRSIASQVLALLAVVWLNLALAPCAMSMGTPMGDGMSHEMGHDMDSSMGQSSSMGQAMSHSTGSGEPPCSHCPPNQSACDTEPSGQCALQAQVIDDQGVTGLSLAQPLPHFAAAPAVMEFIPHPVTQSVDRPPKSLLRAPGIALHKRFCVYLK